ncbi:bola protein [Aspergillus ambiguus]|uniref:BolA family protein n=1 Tax=Aspergillus ambiguus TaxID=176160 RepID=UPI003CCCB9D1
MLLPIARPGLFSRAINLPRAFSVSSRMASATPMEDTIRDKLTHAFTPSTLIIRNDSHLHAHHAPMQGSTSKETHFHVTITSSEFQSKMQPARHRMVYALLKEEMAREGGIHALQLRTKTPEEEQREKERKNQA